MLNLRAPSNVNTAAVIARINQYLQDKGVREKKVAIDLITPDKPLTDEEKNIVDGCIGRGQFLEKTLSRSVENAHTDQSPLRREDIFRDLKRGMLQLQDEKKQNRNANLPTYGLTQRGFTSGSASSSPLTNSQPVSRSVSSSSEISNPSPPRSYT